MTKGYSYRAAALSVALFALLSTVAVGTGSAEPQSASPDDGLRVFKSANCMGCHKWSGVGGGGYGGAAANLRHTALTLEQIKETVRCGIATTGMPHFAADAYSDSHCYGLKKADLSPGQMPSEPDHPLRPNDIQAVATYVMTHIKDKGEPDLAQCQAFFGTGTRVCDVYVKDASSQAASTSSGQDAAPSHQHGTVESAPDGNAPRTLSGQ